MPVRRYLVPFAAGVAVGAVVHKYWPEIQEAAGPTLKRGFARGSDLLDRARTALWEQSEQFADLVAEIREEEAAAQRAAASPAPPPAEPPL
jgi:hypothetical protein